MDGGLGAGRPVGHLRRHGGPAPAAPRRCPLHLRPGGGRDGDVQGDAAEEGQTWVSIGGWVGLLSLSVFGQQVLVHTFSTFELFQNVVGGVSLSY